MRTAFLAAAALLCAVALPVCLVIGGAATPLITFAYGARWLPASGVLLWLALLSALTIFFQLIYDYFVVLAKTRVVFTLQLGWLLALVPALIAGAHLGGIAGAGLAEAAIAGGMILPWYLHELRGAGIRRRALASQLWVPLAGALAAGLVAAGTARELPSDLAALAVSGLMGLAIVGFLVFRMRATLTRLRQGRGEAAAPIASAAPEVPAASSCPPVLSTVPGTTASWPGLPDVSGDIDAPDVPGGRSEMAGSSVRSSDETCSPNLARGMPQPSPAYPDTTGPLPIFDDVARQWSLRRG